MQSTRLPLRRIPLLRPLRPPSRVFTSGRPAHILARNISRPQLPFLSRPLQLRPGRHAQLFIRPISTETRDWVVYQLKLGAYWTIMIWIVVGGCTIGYFIFRQDWLDRVYPSPDEWSYFTKYVWRIAKHEEAEEGGLGVADWATVGNRYRNVVALLEEGALLKANRKPLPQNEGFDRAIPGLDVADMEKEPVSSLSKLEKIGFDVESQSEVWRRGYFEAMMGMAKAAEMNNDWVNDVTRKLSFPRDQMIGPSNPWPKPIWPGSPPAPQEENCRPVFEDPRLYYGKILTTKGLNKQQKIKAGLAYAAWLDYKNDNRTADALYKWALNLAVEGAESSPMTGLTSRTATTPVTSTLIDAKTGIIPSTASHTTANILLVAAAYASHIARFGSLSSSSDTVSPAATAPSPLQALPLYLSILRARRSAASAPPHEFYPPPPPDYSLTSLTSLRRWIFSLPIRPKMSPDEDTPGGGARGDEPYVRTAASDCEDAALMNHVGEILYAATLTQQRSAGTDRRRREALSWTRDAVRIAETGAADTRLGDDVKERCMQCLGAGLENWSKMVGALAQDEKLGGVSGTSQESTGSTSSWRPWTWFTTSSGPSNGQAQRTPGHTLIDPALLVGGNVDPIGMDMPQQGLGEWGTEAALVQKRLKEFQESRLMEQLNKHISAKSSWFVI